tara:strand:+ start:3850 stop:4467 length:618 start_codon:yes stop_codon:yes gene_type:complete
LKQKINIYTNIKSYDFFNQIMTKYILIYKSIEELLSNPTKNDKGGIILNNNINNFGGDVNLLSKNYIVITCDSNVNKTNKNIKILKPPLFPYQLKNSIENFLNINFYEVEDIVIQNQNILNSKNKKTQPLTEIESKILIYLITNKLCTKEYIKENILNIKPSIETNSVETHLTRIRKKFDFINTELIIKSKNNILSIDTNQKNLD